MDWSPSWQPAFACTSTTNAPMDKRMARADSEHQIGPEIPLHENLMIVVSCCTGDEEVWAEVFKLEMFSLVAQQPGVIW